MLTNYFQTVRNSQGKFIFKIQLALSITKKDSTRDDGVCTNGYMVVEMRAGGLAAS